jgi:hypothetical protein
LAAIRSLALDPLDLGADRPSSSGGSFSMYVFGKFAARHGIGRAKQLGGG